ncbi:fungal-specific transcription factor domain-domain-containing protein [Yarrowia lipolytica]|nr:fungal-specific transcription factor domain-domain-containing protein [Yarrowia lipolytica]
MARKTDPNRKVIRRSRGGCHRCKGAKIKCDETKPTCANCEKAGVACDYSLKLMWGGRQSKPKGSGESILSFSDTGGDTAASDTNTDPAAVSDTSSSGFVSYDPKAKKQKKSSQKKAAPQQPPASTSLTNHYVSKRIQDIDTVFQAAPAQKKVKLDKFIINNGRRNLPPQPAQVQQQPIQQQQHHKHHASMSTSMSPPNSFLSTSPTFLSTSPHGIYQNPNLNISHGSSIGNGMTHDSPDSTASLSSYGPVSPAANAPWRSPVPSTTSPFRSPATGYTQPVLPSTTTPSTEVKEEDNLEMDIDPSPISLDSFFGPGFDDLDFSRDLDIVEETYPEMSRDRAPAFYSALIKSAGSPFYEGAPTTSSTSSGSSEEDDDRIHSIPTNPLFAPDLLLEIPFYRDLFQFYFHRTAKLLIPTPDIYYNNPFMTILPRIALSTPHLLSLLLAYSASHRAKVLKQEMPSEMIGNLLGRTFKGLSVCLEDKKEAMSDSTLATAIMLCSFEILSETGASSWKTHLHGAREIVMGRGIIRQKTQAMAAQEAEMDAKNSSNPLALLNGSDVSETDVAFFLLRWVAYIDVLGALSSARATSVLDGQNQNISEMWSVSSWNRARAKSMVSGQCADTLLPDDQIDFFLGFDVAMVPAFAKIADLSRQRRLMGSRDPSREFLNEARSIEAIVKECHTGGQRRRIRLLSDSLHNDILASTSLMNPSQLQGNYTTLCAVNSAFCFAALIHLYRRVLHLPQNSLPVLEAIEGLTLILERDIPPSSGAEMCLSFPIFSAGCEVPAGDLRERFKKRMLMSRTAEHTLITKAQLIIQECWRTGESWTKLMEDRGWNQVIM